MITTGQPLQVSELDFNQIKANLIDYFRNKETGFTDWDFEGSNLNTIIDVLAYNTHYNAMLAHMAVNESFIDSAQLRSSVVSAAKLLGYVPRSRSAAKINCSVSGLVLNDVTSNRVYINRGDTLTTNFNSKNYVFTILDSGMILERNTENNTFSGEIQAYQGSLKTLRFLANGFDSGATYEIPDESIDVQSLIVRVKQSDSSDESSLFLKYSDISNVTNESQIYFLNENSSGRYELTFGNGVFGKKLNPNNIIEIEYLVTDGADGNGVRGNLTMSLYIQELDALRSIVFSSVNRSNGGSDKETIDLLKANALSSFSTQNRAVTADDYRNLLISNFPYLNSVSIWGGEDNIPPAYGKVFVSANKKYNQTITNLDDTEKSSILDYLKSKKVLSIIPELVDPQYCNIVLDIFCKYNPNISQLKASEIEQIIKAYVEQYNTNLLNSFDNIFRHSQFVRGVDTSFNAILNSLVRVYLSQKITIPTTPNNVFTLNFGAPCALDDGIAIISSINSNGSWTINDERVYIADEASTIANVRNIFQYNIENGTQKKIRDIGSFDLSSGIMTLNRLFSDNEFDLTIVVNSISNDIVGKRNQLLNIDMVNTNINVFVDEVASGGTSRSVTYSTFPKER